jgi:cysteine desulfurase
VAAAYLDNNATTPLDPRVADVVSRYMVEEYGNAGSRTHGFGATASKAVEEARALVADVVAARPDEVIFTSGATEANNLALLGLLDAASGSDKRHIVTTSIEHKAVIEPIEHLAKRHEFEVTFLPVDERGWVTADALADALRPDTAIVSTMHVNNETGVELPLDAYAEVLAGHQAWWHVDAAQGFGKRLAGLRLPRIDLISVSSHKVFGPKGVGGLIARRRKYERPPLSPLLFGGGQERGLRPGTLPVALIAGFGEAARLAVVDHQVRADRCASFRSELVAGIAALDYCTNGDQERVLPHTINISVRGVDAEAAIVASRDLVAISNGSACTSSSYEPSHVLTAMGLDDDRVAGALRLSWSHLTPTVNWGEFADRLLALCR